MKRLDTLTFRQLRALDAVARTGSISRAAEELGLTPPAVHSQIRTLEENFRCAMLNRESAGGFVPTPEGAALLEANEQAGSALRHAMHRIDALQKGFAGTVALGVVSTGKYFAPGLVARLREAHPEIEVQLVIGNRDEIVGALQENAIDLVIMGRPPRDPPVTAHLIGEHPHVLIVPPGHRLLALGNIEPEDILSERIILREEGSGTRILAVRFLDRIGGGQPYEAMEMGSNETIKQAVIAGLGIALISQHTVTEELRTGRLIAPAIKDLPILRSWFVIHRQDARLTGAMETVLSFILDQKGSYLPQPPSPG